MTETWDKIYLAYWAPEGEGALETCNDIDAALDRIKKLVASGKVSTISISNDEGPYMFEGTLEVE